MTMPPRVSLADLLAAPLAMTVPDAVSVVIQLAQSPQTGRPRPVELDASHVWLEPDGAVTLAPGLFPRVSEFASLLGRLLGPLEDDVPRGLRFILERAAGHGVDASIPSLSAFAAALGPFQPGDPGAAVTALVARFAEPRPVAAPLVQPAAPAPAARPPAALAADRLAARHGCGLACRAGRNGRGCHPRRPAAAGRGAWPAGRVAVATVHLGRRRRDRGDRRRRHPRWLTRPISRRGPDGRRGVSSGADDSLPGGAARARVGSGAARHRGGADGKRVAPVTRPGRAWPSGAWPRLG